MKNFDLLINWFVSALVILVLSYVLVGVTLDGLFVALVAALVLGLINAFIKPLVIILTLPINVLTLGLFTLIINALMVMLVAAIVPGFVITSFWWGLILALLLSLVNLFFRLYDQQA